MRVEIRHVEAGSDLRRGRRAELLQAELARGPRRAAARAVPPRDAQSSRPAGPGARPRRRDERAGLFYLAGLRLADAPRQDGFVLSGGHPLGQNQSQLLEGSH